jgi:hypothetical protein
VVMLFINFQAYAGYFDADFAEAGGWATVYADELLDTGRICRMRAVVLFRFCGGECEPTHACYWGDACWDMGTRCRRRSRCVLGGGVVVLVVLCGGSQRLRRRESSLMVGVRGGSMIESLFLFRDGAFRRF